MTVVGDIRAAWKTVTQAGLPGVVVSATPMGENEPAKEVVYIERWGTEIDWNTIGCLSRNRKERLRLNIVVRVYREGPDQIDVSEAVCDRCEEIFTAMEDALLVGPQPLRLGGAVSWGRYASCEFTPVAAESGWVALARTVLEAEYRPA